MALIAVADAQARLLADVAPLEAETVALAEAHGRVLAADLIAQRTQPPFAASAMDGYAVRSIDLAAAPARLTVIGSAPAGRGYHGSVGPGQAVRIFTGAPMPTGSDAVLIQENTEPANYGGILATESVAPGLFVRPAGLDFQAGDRLLAAGRRLDYRAIALAAAMNHPTLEVRRRPRVGIIATGDELVPPGALPGPDQITASNNFGIAALVAELGGEAIDLGIAPDRESAIAARVVEAIRRRCDVLVTLGGASVGDHDLVQKTLGNQGLELAFWKIAMRPGKPLMFGHLGPARVLGLPGNPVASLVCGILFLKPLLRALSGVTPLFDPEEPAWLGAAVPANDSRQDYLRATLAIDAAGAPVATAFDIQDSSMLSRITLADCLILRPPHAPAAARGAPCRVLRLI